MIIKELFKKDISRNIEGVVTIGNEDASRKNKNLKSMSAQKKYKRISENSLALIENLFKVLQQQWVFGLLVSLDQENLIS